MPEIPVKIIVETDGIVSWGLGPEISVNNLTSINARGGYNLFYRGSGFQGCELSQGGPTRTMDKGHLSATSL